VQPRVPFLRTTTLALCLLTVAAACSSSDGSSGGSGTTTIATSSTTDPDQTPNSIPYVVGDRIGLPNGWLVRVAGVHRPYTAKSQPPLASGKGYVAIDVTMDNEGTGTHTVYAPDVFSLGDSTGKIDPVVAVPGHPNGIDGAYAPGTSRSGQLVFAVPTEAKLRMAMDGPAIGTQRSIFLIDPPTFSGPQS